MKSFRLAPNSETNYSGLLFIAIFAVIIGYIVLSHADVVNKDLDAINASFENVSPSGR